MLILVSPMLFHMAKVKPLYVNAKPLYIHDVSLYRGEKFALVGHVVPGCVEDGTWMLWGGSSVAVFRML